MTAPESVGAYGRALTEALAADLDHLAVDLEYHIIDILQVVAVGDDLVTAHKVLHSHNQHEKMDDTAAVVEY